MRTYLTYRLRVQELQGTLDPSLIYSTLDKQGNDSRQKELEDKYDVQVKKLKELERKKKANDKQTKIETFITSLKDKEDVITEFDEGLFNIMINKAVVYRNRSIECIFNSGYKVKVEAGE